MDMTIHDGKCKYCGDIQPIMAMDQIDADEKISDECTCGGAIMEQKKKNLYEKLSFAIGDDSAKVGLQRVTPEQEKVITTAALAVLYEVLDKVTFKIDGTTVTITRTAEKVKVKRDDKRTTQLEA